jgi:hypothetical protein
MFSETSCLTRATQCNTPQDTRDSVPIFGDCLLSFSSESTLSRLGEEPLQLEGN